MYSYKKTKRHDYKYWGIDFQNIHKFCKYSFMLKETLVQWKIFSSTFYIHILTISIHVLMHILNFLQWNLIPRKWKYNLSLFEKERDTFFFRIFITEFSLQRSEISLFWNEIFTSLKYKFILKRVKIVTLFQEMKYFHLFFRGVFLLFWSEIFTAKNLECRIGEIYII